ncbi:conserved domain protein [Trichinella spiralis]|uniref:hypothetical protein n=1 Tax=Trichinella spiralis TaxID=6334 RepID=UPI0001EFD604|nr:conserved domain protein [Trichinella spiralis]
MIRRYLITFVCFNFKEQQGQKKKKQTVYSFVISQIIGKKVSKDGRNCVRCSGTWIDDLQGRMCVLFRFSRIRTRPVHMSRMSCGRVSEPRRHARCTNRPRWIFEFDTRKEVAARRQRRRRCCTTETNYQTGDWSRKWIFGKTLRSARTMGSFRLSATGTGPFVRIDPRSRFVVLLQSDHGSLIRLSSVGSSKSSWHLGRHDAEKYHPYEFVPGGQSAQNSPVRLALPKPKVVTKLRILWLKLYEGYEISGVTEKWGGESAGNNPLQGNLNCQTCLFGGGGIGDFFFQRKLEGFY